MLIQYVQAWSADSRPGSIEPGSQRAWLAIHVLMIGVRCIRCLVLRGSYRYVSGSVREMESYAWCVVEVQGFTQAVVGDNIQGAGMPGSIWRECG